MAYSKASQKAVDKYVKNNYDRFNVRFKKGELESIKKFAREAKGKSLNKYITDLIHGDMGQI